METTDNKEQTNTTPKADIKPIYNDCGCRNPNAITDAFKEGFDKVFGNMKKATCLIIMTLLVAIGCTTLPDTDKMYKASKAAGVATGLIANMTDIDTTSRGTIIDIMNTVVTCIPETNQTFYTAWMPIAQRHTQKLIDEKKIDNGEGEIIIATFTVVTKGIDYLFDVKYPKVRTYQNLTESAIHGFSDGFLAVFTPVNLCTASESNCVEYDKDTYLYLMKNR